MINKVYFIKQRRGSENQKYLEKTEKKRCHERKKPKKWRERKRSHGGGRPREAT